MKRIGIFVFYDASGIVDGYVEFLLESMNSILSKLIIIINGDIKDKEYDKFKKYTADIFIRENFGFDAGAYKDVFTRFLSREEILQWDEIVLFNDTFYGPLYPWKIIFEKMEKENIDFWGLSKCVIESLPEHIQSYFLVCRKSLFASELWIEFWSEMEYPQTLSKAISNFEIRFSEIFTNNGYICKDLINSGIKIYDGNPYYTHVGELIAQEKFPIIKRKAITFINFKCINDALKLMSDSIIYDMSLISSHLKRLQAENRVNIGIPFDLIKLSQFYDSHNRIYIYGHGKYGQGMTIYFDHKKWKYEGIIVTEKQENEQGILEYKDISLEDKDGIILALGRKAMSEVYPIVKKDLKDTQIMVPEEYQMLYDKIDAFLDYFAHVYMYGTGKRAVRLIQLYPNIINLIDGFVETEPDRTDAVFYGKKILPAKSVIREGTGFILTMAEKTAGEVLDYLTRNGVQPSQVFLFRH